MSKRKSKEVNELEVPVKKAVKYNYFSMTPLSFYERNQKAQTPEQLYEELNDEFHFEFDPCPAFPDGIQTFDGLQIPWKKINYVNPPYNEIEKWVKKALIEKKKGNTSVFLIPLRADRKYFMEHVIPNSKISVVFPKVTFKGYDRPCPWTTVIAVFQGDSQ